MELIQVNALDAKPFQRCVKLAADGFGFEAPIAGLVRLRGVGNDSALCENVWLIGKWNFGEGATYDHF
jgi:hypothetical protein